jgi:hypothetical protein
MKKAAIKHCPNPNCVVRVGDGRGFIIEHCVKVRPLPRLRNRRLPMRKWAARRLVITAAHCLPKLPPACTTSYTHERTYQNLLGTLGGNATVWAECLFVDPVADIAVLGAPDSADGNAVAAAFRC